MTGQNNEDIGEDDLHAYVDGQLSPERHRVVEAWLAQHPDAAAEVADWQAQNQLLQTIFQPAASPDDQEINAQARITAQTQQNDYSGHDPAVLYTDNANTAENGMDGVDGTDKPHNNHLSDNHNSPNSTTAGHDDRNTVLDLDDEIDDPADRATPARNARRLSPHREHLTQNLRAPSTGGNRRIPPAPGSYEDGPNQPSGRRTHYPFRQMAAALVVFIAGGIGGAAIMEAAIPKQGQSPDYVQTLPEASSAGYGIYASEVRHPVEVYANEKDHLVGWLGKRLGIHFTAPDLTSQGFNLVGGRLVPFAGKPGALLMYEDNSGQRLTMMVGHDADNRSTGFRYQTSGNIETFYWIDGTIGYALSGEIGKAHLEDVAMVVYQQLGA